MRKLFFILLACTILLCSCKSNYTGELPNDITSKTTMSDAVEKFGESQYTYDGAGTADNNALVYDYETQYGKCLIELFFDKKTNKLDYASYVYYGNQKEMIQLLNLISDDMEAKYGDNYYKISNLDEKDDIYKEDTEHDFVYVSYSWNDNRFYDHLNVLYTHQYNENRTFIQELPTCETTVQVNVFLNL